ncbi:death domain-containing protein [Endozoicomonas sp. ALC020]|uniref:death domain-containing protein n=1 Tax=unclassified Endozoicomonas TaxID=2644528 RepID=UPI003BAF26C8
MKTVKLLTMIRLFMLFILAVTFPLVGHSAAFSNLLSWTACMSSSKAIEKRSETLEGISKLSFIGHSPPLHLTYDSKSNVEIDKTISELDNNQLYIILNGLPNDRFVFCFRTPPVFSSENIPSPPVITKSLTDKGLPDIQDVRLRLLASTPGTGRWQYEYTARWRLPAGNHSLVLAVENNGNEWLIEPECSGILSELTRSPSPLRSNTFDGKKASFVDIFYRNKQAVRNEPVSSDDNSRTSGPLAISAAPDTIDNSESFTRSGGGGFGGDDLDDLFKKRPGNGLTPLYSFEWMSDLVSRIILVPVPDADGETLKKQIWDTRILLKIKQGWNEQAIIISQELWRKIKGANFERSTGLFLALSRNPDNPEVAFDHYLSSNPAQPLQAEDYRRYTQQDFILSPKQLLSVSVFPGHCPTGIGCSGGTGQVEKEMADLGAKPPGYSQSQRDDDRHHQGSQGRRGSGGDDGSGRSPSSGLCKNCNKPVVAFNKCRECLNRESNLFEQVANKELSSSTDQNSEMPLSEAKDFNALAIDVFQWFQTLRSNEKEAIHYFHHNDYYNLPELYKLLSHRFYLDKNNLSKFHSKWVEFTKGNLALYSLISEVGELAKSQGVDDYVEVMRIIQALALKRDVYENEISLTLFRSKLINYLASNNLLVSDESDQISYSRLHCHKKAELINFIYQLFKLTVPLVKEETVPLGYEVMVMLNSFAREIYAEFFFGLPDVDDDGLFDVIMWGYANHNQYSFLTPNNRDDFLEVNSHQSLQNLALFVSADGSSNAEEVSTMFTALAIVKSMFSERLTKVFPEHALLIKGIPYKQLDFLRTFTSKAREQLFEVLKLSGEEKKDEFIRSMLLIFGMVPKELSDELSKESDSELYPLSQVASHAVAHPQHLSSKIRIPQSVSLDFALPQGVLQNIGFKLDEDWENFAKSSFLSNADVRKIDADNERVEDKAMAMLELWQQLKVRITFVDLLIVLENIGRDDLVDDIMELYAL